MQNLQAVAPDQYKGYGAADQYPLAGGDYYQSFQGYGAAGGRGGA